MPSVTFTYYHRPCGEWGPPCILTIDWASEEAAAAAEAIIGAGFVLEAETLSNGVDSLTIGDPVEEIDISHLFLTPSMTKQQARSAVNQWLVDFDLVEAIERRKTRGSSSCSR